MFHAHIISPMDGSFYHRSFNDKAEAVGWCKGFLDAIYEFCDDEVASLYSWLVMDDESDIVAAPY